MSDRCAANGAAIRLVEAAWDKSLNVLHCHLHPLDSVAKKCCKALAAIQEEQGHPKGECLAAVMAYKVNIALIALPMLISFFFRSTNFVTKTVMVTRMDSRASFARTMKSYPCCHAM